MSPVRALWIQKVKQILIAMKYGKAVRDLSIKNIILGQNFEGNENSSRKEVKDANFLLKMNIFTF